MNWKAWLGLAVALSLVAGLILWKRGINGAMDFCMSVVEKAEAAGQSTGSYPENLDDIIGNSEPLPDIIRENIDRKHRVYEILDGHPACSFIVTGGFFPRLFTYSGKTKKWKIQD